MYFVRMYSVSDWDEGNLFNVDVYSDYDIKHYRMSGKNGTLELISTESHYFSQCPANIFMLPDEKSVFDCVMSIQDSVNELISGEIDDFSAFCDAYLCLEGVDADTDDIAASASPLKPRVIMLSRSAAFDILLVAWRFSATGRSSRAIPHPLSVTRIKVIPPCFISTIISLAPASIEFSTSSLTADAGRSTTSPAAIRFAT
jgi:hypothetical protein